MEARTQRQTSNDLVDLTTDPPTVTFDHHHPSLDDVDRQILDLLTADGRMPVTTIAKELRIARSTVNLRLARLQSSGVIQGYTVVQSGGTGAESAIRALLFVDVDRAGGDAIVRQVRALPEVVRLHATAGDFDLAADVRCATMADLHDLVHRVGAMTGVQRLKTTVVLATYDDAPGAAPRVR